MADNYYNILNVAETATKDEIKKAYRTLSFKYHPDKNPGNSEATSQFQKISEAYETLSDEEKRQEYDMMRQNPFMRMGSQGGGMNVPMEDIFSTLFGGMNPFGGMGGFPGMPPGAKVHIFHGPGGMGGFGPMGHMNINQALQKPTPIIKNISVTLEQVLTGTTIPIEIERWLIENGNKVFENETIYVSVPQGIDDGELIVIRDKGNILNDSCKGDIKLVVKVLNETMFKRVGLDLLFDKNITLKESLCGFSFEIKYINGKSYTLNNNKGNIIPSEYKKIYPNMGLTRDNHKGNMVIIFHVEFPEKLTEEQIEKLTEIL